MAFSTLPHTSLAQTPFALQHLFKVKTHPKKTKKKNKNKKIPHCPMQSELGTCRQCGWMTAQISVLVLWILSLGETGFLHWDHRHGFFLLCFLFFLHKDARNLPPSVNIFDFEKVTLNIKYLIFY